MAYHVSVGEASDAHAQDRRQGVGWIALSALLLVVSTLLTVVIVGRTDWGHRKLLSIALPQLQKQLAGHLTSARRWRSDARAGVRDVELDDVEHGRPCA